MNGWDILRGARKSLLFFLALICLTWAILFAVFLHHEWSNFSPSQKIVIVFLLSLHVFTAILLYLMAVVRYRPWVDVVRMFTILVVHIGSSVLFTHYRPSFPCRGFGTEPACKEFVFAILVGCWAFSVTFICFATALGVMAFIPQPVKSLPSTDSEEDGLPLSPDLFEASSFTADERRTSLSSTRTGLDTYNNEHQEESLSPGRNAYPVNSIHRVIIPRPMESLQVIQGTKDDDLPSNPSNRGWFKVSSPTADERQTLLSSARTGLVTCNNEHREESLSPDRNGSPVNSVLSTLKPPQFWKNFENRNSGHSNETGSHDGTISLRNTLGGGTSSPDSGSLRVGPFSPNSFHDSSTPTLSIYSHSRLSVIRPGVGGENFSRPSTGRIGILPLPDHSTALHRQSVTVPPPPS